ncbi:MAG: hypothetical protein ACRDVN_04760 [Jiangellaceae bacterium]
MIEDVVAGCRSAPECELRDIVRSSRVLPEPRWNKPLPGYPSITPDACWPLARLVAEVNSREWHGFGNAPAPIRLVSAGNSLRRTGPASRDDR